MLSSLLIVFTPIPFVTFKPYSGTDKITFFIFSPIVSSAFFNAFFILNITSSSFWIKPFFIPFYSSLTAHNILILSFIISATISFTVFVPISKLDNILLNVHHSYNTKSIILYFFVNEK